MGFGELLLLLIVVLLFFGARKLPALGEGLGKAIKGFKDSMGSGAPGSPPRQARAEPKELPPRAPDA